ncbi:hypothetical protein AB3S75_027146 [Citrus x aurantiifolia]
MAELLKELEFDDPFNYREGHDLDAASRRSGSLYPLKIQGQRKWHLEGRARTCCKFSDIITYISPFTIRAMYSGNGFKMFAFTLKYFGCRRMY